jgi:hypothetical protein
MCGCGARLHRDAGCASAPPKPPLPRPPPPRHAFPDGVHHVDCSGLSSSLQLAYALAAALSLQLVGPGEEQVREELIGALAPRRLLIVVDRCDELAEARRAGGGGPAAASSSPAGEAAAAAGSPVAELLALVLA